MLVWIVFLLLQQAEKQKVYPTMVTSTSGNPINVKRAHFTQSGALSLPQAIVKLKFKAYY